jgi:hypothetical protein
VRASQTADKPLLKTGISNEQMTSVIHYYAWLKPLIVGIMNIRILHMHVIHYLSVPAA